MDRGEEQRLIRLAASGNRAAIEALVRSHQASLYAFVVRMTGRPEVAEDVVQESFVRVITNIQRFDTRFRFSTWLFTIARRLYLNIAQKSSPGFDTDAVERRMDRENSPADGLADRESSRQRGEVLQRALAVLSPEQREVVLLFHQHEWPIKAIVDHMHIPEGTVKSHLHRARRALRDAIEPVDGLRAPGSSSLRLRHESADGLARKDQLPQPDGSGQHRSLPAPVPASSSHDPNSRDPRPTLATRLARTEVRL